MNKYLSFTNIRSLKRFRKIAIYNYENEIIAL